MNQTIRNVSQLSDALSASLIKDETNKDDTKNASQPSNKEESNSNTLKPDSEPKRGATKLQATSTSALLTNLSAINSTTNNKLDIIHESILRLDNTLQTIVLGQEKQIQLLGTIARNTVSKNNNDADNLGSPNVSRLNQLTIKDYGYNSVSHLLSDLIRKFIMVVEQQVNAKGKRYRSSRDCTQNIMNTAVEVACKSEFKLDRQIAKKLTLPETKNNGLIEIAKRIGSINDIKPVMNAASFKDLFENSMCRNIIVLMSDIIKRLCIIRYLIPYYEADILSSLEYPYFDKENEIMCRWNELKDRNESPEEEKIINTPVVKRKQIAELIAKGVSVKAAINLVLKDA